jgi:hypothetical protein
MKWKFDSSRARHRSVAQRQSTGPTHRPAQVRVLPDRLRVNRKAEDPDCESGRCGFESRHPPQASVAQRRLHLAVTQANHTEVRVLPGAPRFHGAGDRTPRRARSHPRGAGGCAGQIQTRPGRRGYRRSPRRLARCGSASHPPALTRGSRCRGASRAGGAAGLAQAAAVGPSQRSSCLQSDITHSHPRPRALAAGHSPNSCL